GACDYLSRQWVDYTGVQETAQLGYGWLEQVHSEDRERVRAEWTAAIKSNTTFNTELRIRSKDGLFRWFKTRSVPIHDEEGRVVKWYGTHTDVDDLNRARQDSSERLTRISEWIDEPAIVLDDKLKVRTTNAAAERAFARPKSELAGVPLTDLVRETSGAFLE